MALNVCCMYCWTERESTRVFFRSLTLGKDKVNCASLPCEGTPGSLRYNSADNWICLLFLSKRQIEKISHPLAFQCPGDGVCPSSSWNGKCRRGKNTTGIARLHFLISGSSRDAERIERYQGVKGYGCRWTLRKSIRILLQVNKVSTLSKKESLRWAFSGIPQAE